MNAKINSPTPTVARIAASSSYSPYRQARSLKQARTNEKNAGDNAMHQA
jgi:hypothetical protein